MQAQGPQGCVGECLHFRCAQPFQPSKVVLSLSCSLGKSQASAMFNLDLAELTERHADGSEPDERGCFLCGRFRIIIHERDHLASWFALLAGCF